VHDAAVAPHRQLAVLGLGNTLLGDDAVGPLVVTAVSEEHAFPEQVQVLDLGTPGLDLTPYLLDLDAVLFVDAVRMGAAPGTLHHLSREDLLGAALNPRVSPHDPGVQQALQIVELQRGLRLEVAILGVEPLDTTLGAPLSPPVAGAVPAMKQAILDWVQANLPHVSANDRGTHETSR
jgi:hydrogenase maturation protease